MRVGGFYGKKTKAKLAALESLRANVMIADSNLRITYMNRTMIDMMREAESELVKEIPHFSVDKLIGSTIDIFDKNPQHQRTMLSTLDKPHDKTFTIGKWTFDLKVVPIILAGQRRGFVVEWSDSKERLLNLDFTSQMAAISRTQAVIEFTTDGIIVFANENFLRSMGYTLEEVRGKPHSIFMDEIEKSQTEYKEFWKALGPGVYQSGEFKRVGKNGQAVWIQGSYNPILDAHGKVTKIIKFAIDVTARELGVIQIATALTALAEGDLARRLPQPLIPELDKLRLDFNRASESLHDTMRSVGQAANSVRTGSDEIRSSSEDLSRRTEQQAANLQQTAATLDEITAKVKQTADGARNARDLVGQAKSDAEKSGEVVREAVKSMSGIENSSGQIGQIISVIDEIAFQTNLLALNAGVEAARAGDAGRGFAVVAQEVRVLAQRSAEAAREIKALISESGRQVSNGVNLVGEAGRALERIAGQVTDINGVIADIAASAQEQAVGLNEVNTSVNQMDQVTQQNAAMVEQSTAASHSLAGEAAELSRVVGRFRLGGNEEASIAQPKPRKTAMTSPPPAPVRKPARAVLPFASKGRQSAAVAEAEESWSEF
jgi:methyl-accepting chemotaxis protein